LWLVGPGHQVVADEVKNGYRYETAIAVWVGPIRGDGGGGIFRPASLSFRTFDGAQVTVRGYCMPASEQVGQHEPIVVGRGGSVWVKSDCTASGVSPVSDILDGYAGMAQLTFWMIGALVGVSFYGLFILVYRADRRRRWRSERRQMAPLKS